mgnify:CR=1 FL=1
MERFVSLPVVLKRLLNRNPCDPPRGRRIPEQRFCGTPSTRCFVSLRQALRNQRRGRVVLELRLERHAGLEAGRHRTHGRFASPRLIGRPFSKRRDFEAGASERLVLEHPSRAKCRSRGDAASRRELPTDAFSRPLSSGMPFSRQGGCSRKRGFRSPSQAES